ncbi:hypothetical protein OMP43_21750 [Sphingomonas sp. CBMAI 2297]|uniref:hypothetical protein n=1 Tax=Sphingomonas sp. CBMAI 2297 TaxID=2991720 RepID=UPI002455D6CB|nr:hypothetical protein [Sphingomonas sp. CBMAI 2297]MDH4746655.1 hypothetical protein [Sphingomonas sp. CBMAI 2297]
MSAIHGAVAAMAASAIENFCPVLMRPKPIDRSTLRRRDFDHPYPFRSRRTCAELIAAGLM